MAAGAAAAAAAALRRAGSAPAAPVVGAAVYVRRQPAVNASSAVCEPAAARPLPARVAVLYMDCAQGPLLPAMALLAGAQPPGEDERAALAALGGVDWVFAAPACRGSVLREYPDAWA